MGGVTNEDSFTLAHINKAMAIAKAAPKPEFYVFLYQHEISNWDLVCKLKWMYPRTRFVAIGLIPKARGSAWAA